MAQAKSKKHPFMKKLSIRKWTPPKPAQMKLYGNDPRRQTTQG